MIIDTLSAEDTALALRTALGPTRGWHDFLADCIRGRTSLFGRRLLPVIKIKKIGDRCKRPLYATADLHDFIIYALKVIARPVDTRALSKIKIDIDPLMLALPLGTRRAKLA